MSKTERRHLPSECREFFLQFHKFWKLGHGLESLQGVHKTPDGSWDERLFLIAISRAAGRDISQATVKSWLLEERWPQVKNKELILEVFFPKKFLVKYPALEDDKYSIENAWEKGRVAIHALHPGENTAEVKWRVLGDAIDTEGIVRATIDEPTPTNNDGVYSITARIFFGISEFERANKPTVYVGLRSAFLVLPMKGMRTVNGTLIGERGEHDHFVAMPDCVQITGPVDNRMNCLRGNPLQDEYIAHAEMRNQEETAVGVEVFAYRRSFFATLDSPEGNISSRTVSEDSKNAIINLIITKKRKDARGRTLLANDTRRLEEEL